MLIGLLYYVRVRARDRIMTRIGFVLPVSLTLLMNTKYNAGSAVFLLLHSWYRILSVCTESTRNVPSPSTPPFMWKYVQHTQPSSVKVPHLLSVYIVHYWLFAGRWNKVNEGRARGRKLRYLQPLASIRVHMGGGGGGHKVYEVFVYWMGKPSPDGAYCLPYEFNAWAIRADTSGWRRGDWTKTQELLPVDQRKVGNIHEGQSQTMRGRSSWLVWTRQEPGWVVLDRGEGGSKNLQTWIAQENKYNREQASEEECEKGGDHNDPWLMPLGILYDGDPCPPTGSVPCWPWPLNIFFQSISPPW